uniref:Uncharacterized protein n=1 Tax=Romanomermis culicivorax TaxID=13658 RepID=A0A915I4P5_ROMCU
MMCIMPEDRSVLLVAPTSNIRPSVHIVERLPYVVSFAASTQSFRAEYNSRRHVVRRRSQQ